MIIVKLAGGLGNQMFQYAAARGTGDRTIFFDLAHLENHNPDSDQFTPRIFEIDIFSNLMGRKFNPLQEKLFNSDKWIYKALRNISYGRMDVVKQRDNEFVTIPKSNRLLLHGFFQSEKYFKPIRVQLLQEFGFPPLDEQNLKLADKIKVIENPVSIHVRRGDYLKPKVQEYHGILPIEYYQKSMAFIESKTSNPFYFIFSDDPAWCEANLASGLSNYVLVKGNTDSSAWMDMCLMTLCKHHIIANSSFSWWGAWLGSNPDKIVLAPSQWFNDVAMNTSARSLIPESWIRI